MSLKAFVSFLMLPFPLILILLVGGISLLWFTSRQRTGRVLVTVGGLLLLIVSWPTTNDLLLAPLRGFPPLLDPAATAAGARWVVVLGAGNSTRAGVPATGRLDDEAIERLVEGIRIHRALPDAKLVLSGGSPSGGVTASQVMAEAVASLGVLPADVVQEPRTLDTEDEARLIRQIVGDDRFILVTSAVHMRRAVRLFQKQGMQPIPAPAGFWPGGRAFLPRSRNVVAADAADHEYLGMIWAKLRGRM